MDDNIRLRVAVFDRFTQPKTAWKALSLKYDVSVAKLRTAYKQWMLGPSMNAQPQSYRDITLTVRSPGRPCSLTVDQEQTIVDAINYFAGNHTPLTKQGMLDLVQEYVSLLPATQREKIKFNNNRPSTKFCELFLTRHHLALRAVRQVEDKRVLAMTPEHVTEHIARFQAAMDRYRIHDPWYIFNMDQSGCSFGKIIGRSLRKGVGRRGAHLVQKTITTKGDLDRVTIMPVVSASGKAYTPCVTFPGKKPHYRIVRGEYQTLEHNLMDCLLYHRDSPGADSAIVYDWAVNFVRETEHLRANQQHLLLVLDGYAAHVQFRTLQLFRDNNIITIALPAHTSHELQPLDVTVFGAFKSYLQRDLHRVSKCKKQLNAFDVASVIQNAYAVSFVAPTVSLGFIRCGVWDPITGRTNVSALQHLFTDESGSHNVSLDGLINSFLRKNRSLLRDANVEHEGRIRIATTTGAHITSETFLRALQARDLQKREEGEKKRRVEEQKEERIAYKEPAADIRRLLLLAEERGIRKEGLLKSRYDRRTRQKTLIRFFQFTEIKTITGHLHKIK